jgi:hypothetical protein
MICLLENMTWREAFDAVTDICREEYDMPSSDVMWGKFLSRRGYTKHIIPDTCPDCYTVNQFCLDNPDLTGILATGTHVIAVCDGNYFDTWDSGDEIPIYYWRKEN